MWCSLVKQVKSRIGSGDLKIASWLSFFKTVFASNENKF